MQGGRWGEGAGGEPNKPTRHTHSLPSIPFRLTRLLIHRCEEIMRPFLQKRLIDLLPSSRSGADAAGGNDGEQAAGEGGGGSKKRKAAKGGEEEQEGEEEEEATTMANAAAAGGAGGGIVSQLKGCDVFSALLKVCGCKTLPHRGERGGRVPGGAVRCRRKPAHQGL